MRVAVVDSGGANLASVEDALSRLNVRARVTSFASEIAEPALGIRVYVAEAEVDDGAGRIRNAVEDIEVIESTFRSGEKPGVIRGAGCICRSRTPDTKGV